MFIEILNYTKIIRNYLNNMKNMHTMSVNEKVWKEIMLQIERVLYLL